MSALTWREGTARYLETYSATQHAVETQARTRRVFGHFRSWLGRDVPLEEVTRGHIEEYQRARLAARRSNYTINCELRHLRAFFRWLERREIIPRDPTRWVDALPERKRAGRVKVLPQGIRELVSWLTRQRRSALADLVLLIANTGVRLGEALNLRWRDVDLAGRILWIRCSEVWQPKDGEDRGIRLNRRARVVLRRRRKLGGDLVFRTRSGRPFSRRNVLRDLQRAAARSGAGRMTFQAIRRLFAREYARRATHEELAQVLGHASPTTTHDWYLDAEVERQPIPAEIR